MNDETSKEEADEDGALHVDIVLVMSGGLGEAEEKKEAADEKDRIVSKDDGPSEEEDVYQNHPSGNRIIAIMPGNGVRDAVLDTICSVFHAKEFFAEQSEVEDVAEEDGDEADVEYEFEILLFEFDLDLLTAWQEVDEDLAEAEAAEGHAEGDKVFVKVAGDFAFVFGGFVFDGAVDELIALLLLGGRLIAEMPPLGVVHGAVVTVVRWARAIVALVAIGVCAGRIVYAGRARWRPGQ